MNAVRIQRPSKAVRIPIPTYNLLCTQAAFAGQQLFDFVGTLLEVWDALGPASKVHAALLQAEKKRIELSELESEKRSLTK